MDTYKGVCLTDMVALNIPAVDFSWDTFEHKGHNITWTKGSEPPAQTLVQPQPVSMPAVIIKDNKDMEQAIVMSEEQQFQSDVQTIKDAMARLGTVALEREDAIKALFLSLLARQHIVLYGEGGTGKNWLVKHFTDMVDMQYFYYQIYQATTENHLFGSIDYKKMHDTGEMAHVHYHSMIEAEIAFLDEIGNSSGVIRNLLKNPMEERSYKDGYEEIPLPLQMIVGASNSIIEYKKDATEAAFADRWLSRVHVQRIQKPENRIRLLKLRWEEPDWPKIDRNVIRRLQSYLGRVTVSDDLYRAYNSMRDEMFADPAAGNLDMSDRRHEHTMLLVRASAILHGRLKAKRSDLSVYGMTAWNNHVEHEDTKLADWLKAKLTTALVEVEGYDRQVDDAYQAYEAAKTEINPDPAELLSNGMLAAKQLGIILNNLNKVRQRLEDDEEVEAANKVERKITNYQAAVLSDTSMFTSSESSMAEQISQLKK